MPLSLDAPQMVIVLGLALGLIDDNMEGQCNPCEFRPTGLGEELLDPCLMPNHPRRLLMC